MAGDDFQVQMRIEPEGSSDSSVSIITQIAVQVGADRVTFGVPQSSDDPRAQVVWVDGTPSTIDETNPVLTLAGGTVTEVSSNEYQVALNTGEVVTVNPFGDGMGFNVALAPNATPGSVQGFLGPDTGEANDFSLPDGTVLKQPLTQDQLYQQFANAWRVTDATSLLDYDSGQDTATFTNKQYPREILTLADFPSDLVAKAMALVSAAGITDPTLAADAAFDYISMGNPSFISEDATIAGENPTTPTAAIVTQTVAPDPSLGVFPSAPAVTESQNATTSVTFAVNLTSASSTDTVVNYAVTPNVDYLTNTAGKVFFSASDLGGTLPSGSVTIAAGQTEADVTIAVPNSALAAAPSKWLGISITTPGSDPIYDPTAQVEVLNNAPVAGTPAAPVLELLPGASSSGGTMPVLTQSGSTYTLDLGQVSGGATLPQYQFALANMAAPGSDSLVSAILSTAGSGFTVSGSQPSTAILAGSSYSGLYVQPVTTSLGAQSETITFSATDTNSSGYTAVLPNVTLVVTDTVVAQTTNRTTPVAPMISGTVAGQTTAAEAPIAPFATTTIADGNAAATDGVTVTLSGEGGTLTGTGLSGGTGGVYALAAASPAAVTADLDALSFVAAAGAPGVPSTTTFALSDASTAGTSASDSTTTVIDTAATTSTPKPVAPTISGTVAGQTTAAEAPIAPFATTTIADGNAGATDGITITLSGEGGTLTGTGLSGGAGGVYTLAAASPAAVTAELDALSFVAAAGAPGVPSTTTFALSDASSAGTSATDGATTVIDTAATTSTPKPIAPTISGTVAGETTAAEAPIAPFAKTTIADGNAGATDGVTVTLSGEGGTLTGTGLSGGVGGVYTLAAASPAAVTAELDALSFVAAAGAPGVPSTTTFALSDASSAGTSATDGATTVIDTAATTSTSTPGAPPPGGGTPSGPGTAPPSTAPAADAIAFDPNAIFDGHGTFGLTGEVSSAAGVKSVKISARIDGVETDLGAATVNPNGTFSYVDNVGAHVQGFFTATETDSAGGTARSAASYSLEAGIGGASTVAREDHYTADGSAYTSSTLYGRGGSSTIEVDVPGQTVTSSPYDIVDNHHQADTTFAFNPGFGIDVIKGFTVGGPNHDVLDLPASDFTSIADLLRNTGDIQGSAWVTDPKSGDAIRLAGVTTAELKAHPKDIAFHT